MFWNVLKCHKNKREFPLGTICIPGTRQTGETEIGVPRTCVNFCKACTILIIAQMYLRTDQVVE